MKNILKSNIIFKGFTEEEIDDALEFLKGKEKIYPSKETILHRGEKNNLMGIVLSGKVLIRNIDYLGNEIILGYSDVGSVFGEVYAYLDNIPLMVDVITDLDTKILWLDLSYIKNKEIEDKIWFPKIMKNLLTLSSKKNLNLSQRNFNTQPKSIRGRVLYYLTSESIIQNNSNIEIPFNREQMANYLGINRSALSAELSKMERENILRFNKNKFSLNTDFFEQEEI